jgi:hypothetical protein
MNKQSKPKRKREFDRLVDYFKQLESDEDKRLELNNGRQQSGRIFKRK